MNIVNGGVGVEAETTNPTTRMYTSATTNTTEYNLFSFLQQMQALLTAEIFIVPDEALTSPLGLAS